MDIESHESELLWRNLTLTECLAGGSKKAILRGVSGSASPSTMTALMGTSGAGKTSLFNSLAGRLPSKLNLKGEILLNSHPRARDSWPEVVGYVEQEFHAYEYQTVFETLMFASKIKIGSAMDTEKITRRISEIIALLGLKNARDTYIANLSGGERKRVSIAVELLTDPPVLFCDEPTSGLDSFNSLIILNLLKEISKMGKTIIVTIHHPSYEMLSLFDSIILMSMGQILHQGNVGECIKFFERCGFPLPEMTNPADFFLSVISLDTRTSCKEERSMNAITHLKNEWIKSSEEPMPKVMREIRLASKATGSSLSFFLLCLRNLSNYLRNKTHMKIKVFQKLFFIVVFGMAYLQMGYSVDSIFTRVGGITFMITNAMFGISSPILNVFPQEKKIIVRERRSGMYSGAVAYFAKYFSELVTDLWFELPYVTTLYWMMGLNPDPKIFLTFVVVIFSIIMFSLGYGLTISTMAPTSGSTQILGSIVSLVLFIYSGSLNNPETIPVWLRWITKISPVYYAVVASFRSQLIGVVFEQEGRDSVKGEDILRQRGVSGVAIWSSIFAIWGITLVWVTVGAIVLHYSTKTNIKMESSKEEV